MFWIVGLLATLWNIVLFFPVMWGTITDYQVIALVIVILLLIMNLLYVYVRKRNGLAAAWICQIVTNLIILYMSRRCRSGVPAASLTQSLPQKSRDIPPRPPGCS